MLSMLSKNSLPQPSFQQKKKDLKHYHTEETPDKALSHPDQ